MTTSHGEYHLPVDFDESSIGDFEAAQILEISVDELREMRGRNRGPAYVAIARDIVRYYPDVVFAYGEAVANDKELHPLGF